MRYLAHHYIADVAGEVHWEHDWNDDWWTRGCVTGLWQYWWNGNKTIFNYL